jgi:hypothetical protein
MKRFATKLLLWVVVAAAAVGGVAVGSLALHHANAANGAPSGPHFNLNIHGVANGQGFNGNNQNDIFVPLGSSGSPARCDILLQQAATYDFRVLQPDCVNDPPASFELPAPCAISAGACTGTTTYYSVYARALGKPGGTSSTTLCYTDTNGTYCSLTSYVAVRGTGNSKFANETSNLLFITLCNTTTGKTVTTPLFANSLAQYFWQYDNQGLRLLQLRFYQVGSTVPTGGNPCG